MVYWSAVRDKSMSPPVLTEESIRNASTRESDPLESIRSLVMTFTVCGTSSVFMFVRVAELTVSALSLIHICWNSLPWQAYRMRNSAWTHIPINSPAACASA